VSALTILLGGVDITTSVDLTTVVMQLAGSQETATCEFDIADPTNSVSAADETTLTVTEVGSATVLFGGFVRSRRVLTLSVGRTIHVQAADYNSLLDRSVVVSDSRSAGESDHARLVYLMSTYGTQFSSDYSQIATMNGSMPDQKFIALTLRQAVERVLGQASILSSYYVDPTGRLHTFDRTTTTAAPYDVRVGTPGAGELAPAEFSIDNDSSNLANAIYVVGSTAAGSSWFTDITSIGIYGRRERFVNAPDSDTFAKASQVGNAALTDQKDPVPRGVLVTQSPYDGWRIGQSITVNSVQHGLTNKVYRVARVTVKYLNGVGDREYTIELGGPLPSITSLLGATFGGGGGYPWISPGGPGGAGGLGGGGGGPVSTGRGDPCADCPPYVPGGSGILGWVGTTSNYTVQNKESNHSGDPLYHTNFGRRANYSGSGAATYSSLSGISPHQTSDTSGNVQREWVEAGGFQVRTIRVQANPDSGYAEPVSDPWSPLLGPVYVAVWYTTPLIGTPPDTIIPLNTDLDVSAHESGVYIQPWVMSGPLTATTGTRRVYWAGFGPGLGDPSFTNPPGDEFPRTGYEPYVVKYETGGTFVAPSAGQTVAPEGVVETPDGSRTKFTIVSAPAYVLGSLHVSVNSVDWTAEIVSQDPSKGTFTLSYAPKAGSDIVVTYRAADATVAISDWSAAPAFGTRTASGTISRSGESGFTISGKKFAAQTGSGVISIHLENCTNFVITDCDFDGDTENIFLHNCSDFEISWCRSNNIIGPHARDGSHRANFVQMDSCTQFHIHDIKIVGGDTEDVISCFRSGGRSSSSPSIIERVAMDLTGWTSGSGTGVILGDGGTGSYVEVRNCTFLHPGQVGIQIIDGVGHKVHHNKLYSEPGQPTSPNVAVSSFSGSPDAEVSFNDVYWRKNDGTQNPRYFGAGSINDHDNSWNDTALTAASIAVSL
jgi:hypothetical protein